MALLLTAVAFGQGSNPVTLSITDLSPDSAVAGAPGLTMEVTGTGFLQNAVVIWRFGGLGSTALSTTWVNPTLLRASVPASLLQSPTSIPVVVQQIPLSAAVLPPQTSNTLTFTILAGLSITSQCPLPNAITGQPYTTTITASGGHPPYQFSLFAGSLPPGFSLSMNGTISGQSAMTADSSFVLEVRDSGRGVARKTCSLRVGMSLSTVFVFSLEPNTALVGAPAVDIVINGTGFRNGVAAIWNRGLPGETILTSALQNATRITAQIPGALLREQGEFTITVRQPAGTGTTLEFSNSEVFTVVEQVLITTPCPLRDLTQGAHYTERLIVTGGFPGYSWDVAGGELPPGLALDPNGTLAGIPTTPGLFRFTLRVADSRDNTAVRECSQLVLGPISVFPSQLSFMIDGTGVAPPVQEISVTTAGDGVAFTSNSNVTWLQLGATSSLTPAIVRVLVNPAGLAQGVHRGRITLNSERASNRTTFVDVTLTIQAPVTPRLSALPEALRYSFPRGATAVMHRLLRVLNGGTGSISFTAQATTLNGPAGWLGVSPAAGTASAASPATLRVPVSPALLGPGVYRGRITLRGGGVEITVPVTVVVSQSPESMTVSQSGLLFTAAAGGPRPPRQRFQVLANGQNGFFWETAVSTLSGGSWLRADPPSNSSQPGAPGSTEIEVDPSGLPPDLYFGEVEVRAAVDNSPRLVSVVLQVLNPAAVPPPGVEPGGLVFTSTPNGPLPPVKPVLVRNLSNTTASVSFQINSDPPVFGSGSGAPVQVPPGGTRRIDVTMNPSNRAAGVYRGSMAIYVSNDPQVRLVDLAAILAPGIAPGAQREAGRTAAGCVPTRLVPVSTLQTLSFVAPTGLPVPLEMRVLDDCGEPMTAGAVTMSFTPGSQGPVPLSHLGEGRWSGTWQVQGGVGPVTATITADDAVNNLQGTLVLNGEVQATAGVPVIADGGVVSAASFAPEAPLSPGSLFAAFGSSLADGTSTPNGFPLPVLLGTTRVAIGGRETPLFYAGPSGAASQINGMLPYGLLPNATYQMSIRRGNRRSNYAEVALGASQPAVFTLDQSGAGQGIVVDGARPTVVVDASNPIQRGSVVVIYAEGLGAVNRSVNAGEPAPSGPLAEVIAPVSVTIGGQNAQVLFAGLTPFFTGLYQLNVFVPETVTPGNAVEVVVNAGGQTSPPVTIAVR